jgi:hypothetical protein
MEAAEPLCQLIGSVAVILSAKRPGYGTWCKKIGRKVPAGRNPLGHRFTVPVSHRGQCDEQRHSFGRWPR